jgi:hypothetical protein
MHERLFGSHVHQDFSRICIEPEDKDADDRRRDGSNRFPVKRTDVVAAFACKKIVVIAFFEIAVCYHPFEMVVEFVRFTDFVPDCVVLERFVVDEFLEDVAFYFMHRNGWVESFLFKYLYVKTI